MKKDLMRKYTISIIRVEELYSYYGMKLGINESEFCLLYALYPNYILSQKEISVDWAIPKSTLNTIVKKYENKGYLIVERKEGTKRELLIKLSKSGKKFAEESLKPIYKAEKKAIRKFLEKYDESYLSALDDFSLYLKEAFEN